MHVFLYKLEEKLSMLYMLTTCDVKTGTDEWKCLAAYASHQLQTASETSASPRGGSVMREGNFPEVKMKKKNIIQISSESSRLWLLWFFPLSSITALLWLFQRSCCNKDFSPWGERYYNIQITAHGKLIGLINVQVNDDTVNTFH